MEVKYNLSKKDYIDYHLDNIKHSDYIVKMFFFRKIVLGIIFFSFAYIFLGFIDYSFKDWMVLFFMILITVLLLEAVGSYIVIRLKLAAEIKNYPNILGDKHLVIEEEGIVEKVEDLLIPWKEIKFIDDEENHFYIFILSGQGYIVPKKFFRSQEDMEVFFQEIRKRTGY